MHFVRDSREKECWVFLLPLLFTLFISLVSTVIIHPHWWLLLIFQLEFSHSLLVKPENKGWGGREGGRCSCAHLMLVPWSPHWLRLTCTLSLQEPSQGWLLTPSLPVDWFIISDYLVRNSCLVREMVHFQLRTSCRQYSNRKSLVHKSENSNKYI